MKKKIERMLRIRRRQADVGRARARAAAAAHQTAQDDARSAESVLSLARREGSTACGLQLLAEMHGQDVELAQRARARAELASAECVELAVREQRAQRLLERVTECAHTRQQRAEQKEQDERSGGRR